MPMILEPLREAHPGMTIELWEDVTVALLELLRNQRLDAALIATEVPHADLSASPLFVEPFFAALPPKHRLAHARVVKEKDLAGDLLVLAYGRLSAQTLAACGRDDVQRGSLRAASLHTLVNLVAAPHSSRGRQPVNWAASRWYFAPWPAAPHALSGWPAGPVSRARKR
jgi:LysR family hydrogen peroxide-inducible transcriptional activator